MLQNLAIQVGRESQCLRSSGVMSSRSFSNSPRILKNNSLCESPLKNQLTTNFSSPTISSARRAEETRREKQKRVKERSRTDLESIASAKLRSPKTLPCFGSFGCFEYAGLSYARSSKNRMFNDQKSVMKRIDFDTLVFPHVCCNESPNIV